MRERLPVDSASFREWVSRPEWAYLVAFMHELCDDALAALMSADPRDTASVARAQTEVRFARFFTQGELADAIKEELKEQGARSKDSTAPTCQCDR